MTKLTPALIEQIRAKAAQGFSAHQTAAALGLDRSYLVKQAGQLGIRFNKLPKGSDGCSPRRGDCADQPRRDHPSTYAPFRGTSG